MNLIGGVFSATPLGASKPTDVEVFSAEHLYRAIDKLRSEDFQNAFREYQYQSIFHPLAVCAGRKIAYALQHRKDAYARRTNHIHNRWHRLKGRRG